jgi:hypothetical protein
MIMTQEEQGGGRARRRGLRAQASERREAEIDRLVQQASERGGCTDRMYWTLHYDFEQAPMTTNMQQLQEVGVDMPPEAELNDRALQQQLWEVIETLADLGTYLLRTDHLDDRALYRLLHEQVLREPVRDLPPSEGVSEFIDLGVRAPADAQPLVQRDRFMPRPEAPPMPSE